MRTPASIFEDLGYGDFSGLMQLLEEVSTLLEAFRDPFWILAPDF